MDGKLVKKYTLPDTAVSSQCIYSDSVHIFFLDSKQEHIYTWNKASNAIELYMQLPAVTKDKLSHFVIKDNMVYLASNLFLFIVDKTKGTVQNLSQQFYELAKQHSPNSLGIGFCKLLFTTRGDFFLVNQKDFYKVKKKLPSQEQFRQTVLPDSYNFATTSFRALAEDDKKNIYASYYTGIAKKTSGSNTFIPLPGTKELTANLKATYSLNYWKGYLLWNNIAIDLRSGEKKIIAGGKFGGHCTQYLHNDTLWLLIWGSKKLHCYDLLRKHLASYDLDKKFGNNSGSLSEINVMISDTTGSNFWICTSNDGISLINREGKIIKNYPGNDLVKSNRLFGIYDLYLSGNELWFGYSEGLGVLNTVTGQRMFYKDPMIVNNGILQNRTVFSIFPDSTGNFYLGSSIGLIYFDTRARVFYNLADDHPLAKAEYNRASAFKASNGRYYFGSTDGLYSFVSGELEFFKSSNILQPIKQYGISIFNSDKKTIPLPV